MTKENKTLIEFADKIKWEFYLRLKDETQPAEKEFSYIDLLHILAALYPEFSITKEDLEEFRKEKAKKDFGLTTQFLTIKEFLLHEIKNSSGKDLVGQF